MRIGSTNDEVRDGGGDDGGAGGGKGLSRYLRCGQVSSYPRPHLPPCLREFATISIVLIRPSICPFLRLSAFCSSILLTLILFYFSFFLINDLFSEATIKEAKKANKSRTTSFEKHVFIKIGFCLENFMLI